MIHESYPWKQDLLRRKRLLEKYNHIELLNIDDDKAYFEIEKSIFYSAFIIRKLIDCRVKVSDAVDNYSFQVKTLSPKKSITILSNSIDNDSHDWDHMGEKTVAGKNICNWLIHSLVFSLLIFEDKVTEFVVSSDYDKNKVMYCVNLEDWINYMNFVATDNIVSLNMHYENKLNDYQITQKDREK